GVKYWYFFLPIIIMAASIIMLLMYYRNNASRELTNKQRILLMSLRFLTIAATAFLLLSPFIQTLKRTVQNPLIIAAWDNSESMISTSDSAKASAEIIKLKEKVSEELGNDYQLLNYSFGEEAKSDQTLDFSDRKSDYGTLLATLANNHYNEKIGALIITGDGIINQGRNPLNMINDFNIPVYTIGLGDTTEITDARIQDIRVNRTSFSGNRFPVEVDAVFTKLKGTPLKISITD